jgi:hypothetical protein
MKKTIFWLLLQISLVQCEKDKPINIVLYDKTLEIIQENIQGKWKLMYAEGGICGTCINACEKCTVEFTSDNRFITNSFIITSDTSKIKWVRDAGEYLNGDSTFIMKVFEVHGIPCEFVIDSIYNNILIYHDNASDPMFYHCRKIK